MPSPGGQPSRIADHANNASKAEQAACDIPSTSLQGYHAAPREQRERPIRRCRWSRRGLPPASCGPARTGRRAGTPATSVQAHHGAQRPIGLLPAQLIPAWLVSGARWETYRDRDSGLWRRWGGAQARRSILPTEGQVEHVVNLAVAVVRRCVASSWS
jgi:hypothetical protein